MTAPAARATRQRQSRGSQFLDAAFLLALLFVTLFVTTFVLADDPVGGGETKAVPIAELDISAAEKQQFEAMKDEGMVDDATAAALVEANAPSDDKYEIAWGSLVGTIALAVLYLGFVYAASFREFREVVAARFGRGEDR
jgi:hypothetical protein